MSDNPIPPVPTEPTQAEKPDPKRRRRRRWPWVVGGLFAALLLLVLLAPTIASLGFVRSMILPGLSSSLAPNGKLEVDSWSFGWFSGQKVQGVRLLDDQNAVVAHLDITTGASLFSLLRGNLDVGQTTVTGDFDARIDPDTGRVNLLHILGTDASPAGPEKGKGPSDQESDDEPTELPALKGRVLVDLTGTISSTRPDSKAIPFTRIERAKLDLDLSNIETGVAVDGLIKGDVSGKPASVTIKGTADAVEDGELLTDPDRIAADLNVKIDRLDLTLINAVLAALDMAEESVAGQMQGSLAINLTPGGAATIRSGDNLGIDSLVYTGPALQGDTLALHRTDLAINITRQQGVITLDNTGLKTDLASVQLSGSVPQQALQNLQQQKSPAGKGSIKAEMSIPDFARVAAMLPNTIALKEGTTVTGGALTSTSDIRIEPQAVTITQRSKVDASGTADGKPIRLDETRLDATATLITKDGQPVGMKAIRELTLDLVAPFATIKGGGVPEKFALDGTIDATKARQNISQFIDLGDNDFGGVVNFALNTQGLPADTAAPLAARLTFDTQNLTYSQGGETLLENEKFTGDIDLLYRQTANERTVTFRKLVVGTESGLLGIWTAGDSQWVSLFENGAIAGEAKIISRLRPDKFAAIFAKNADPSMKLTRGVLDSVLELALDKDKNEYRINLQSDLNKLDVGNLLKNERLQLGVTMFVPNSMTASHTWYEVASSFLAIKGEADVKLTDPKGGVIAPLDRVQKLSFDGNVPSIAKVHALARSLIGQPATPAEPVAPLKIAGGTAAFNGTLTRDQPNQTLAIVLDVPAIEGLRMSRGEAAYRQERPASVAFSATIDTAAQGDTLSDQIRRIVVSKLEAQMPGIVSVTMPTPIRIADLNQETPSASGAIRAEGSLQPLGELLGVINGSNPLPVAGSFQTQQALSTSGSVIAISGNATLAGLQPTGKDAKPLPQTLQTIELVNDVSADLKAMSATLRRFDLVVPQARDVLSLSASGSVRELGTRNAFDGLKAVLAYDLPRLWPILQPFADPTGESIGRIEGLAGKYEKTFTVSGSYPTADAKGNPIPFNRSVASVEVGGDLQVDHANLVDQGIEVAGVSIPVTLKGGVARILYPNGTGPKPFAINGGEGSIGGLAIDLTGEEPILVRARDYQIVKGATLNPMLSNALGKYFNPIFPNATKATALVDVKLTADKVRLGDGLFGKNSGKAVVTLSLTKMEISNPLGEAMLGGVINKAGGAFKLGGIDTSDFSNFRGELRDATFTLDRGVITQDATFMIGNIDSTDEKGKPRLYPFTFTGNVSLGTLEMNLAAGLPTQIIRNKAKGEVAQILAFVPDSLPIGLRGPTTNAKVSFEKLGNVFTEAIAKYGASRLLGGDKKEEGGKEDGKQTDLEKAADILGGLLGGDRDKQKAEPPRDDAPRRKPDQ